MKMIRLALICVCLLLCSRAAADSIRPQFPADVTINQDAGRGGLLFVTLRLKSGEELPFVMDTGMPLTLFDKSLEPKLGRRLERMTIWDFGARQDSSVYATPALFLGNTRLMTDGCIATMDFRKISSLCGHPIMGILGFDCLRHYCVQLDFANGKLRFLKPEQISAADLGKSFALTFSGRGQNFPPMFSDEVRKQSLPFIHHAGLLGGSNANALIDTGCNYDGRVEKRTLKGHYGTRIIHFFIPLRALRWPKCVWDDQTYTHLNLEADKDANVIGLRFLARHLVTLDFPKRTLYLKQTSTAPLAKENPKSRPGNP